MAKLTEFQTPTGQRGNLMKPMSLIPMIVGTVVMAAVVTVGMKLYGMLSALVPGKAGNWLGGGPFTRTNQNSQPAPTGPVYRLYN